MPMTKRNTLLGWICCSLMALATRIPSSGAFVVPLQGISRGTIMYPTSTRQYLFDFFKPEDKEGKTKKLPAPDTTTLPPTTESTSSEDPVDKIFSFFFGEKEENPMGMKRFGRGAQLSPRRHGTMFFLSSGLTYVLAVVLSDIQ